MINFEQIYYIHFRLVTRTNISSLFGAKTKVFIDNVSGIGVFSHLSNSNSLINLIIASFVVNKAKRSPIHIRGPSPVTKMYATN